MVERSPDKQLDPNPLAPRIYAGLAVADKRFGRARRGSHSLHAWDPPELNRVFRFVIENRTGRIASDAKRWEGRDGTLIAALLEVSIREPRGHSEWIMLLYAVYSGVEHAWTEQDIASSVQGLSRVSRNDVGVSCHVVCPLCRSSVMECDAPTASIRESTALFYRVLRTGFRISSTIQEHLVLARDVARTDIVAAMHCEGCDRMVFLRLDPDVLVQIL